MTRKILRAPSANNPQINEYIRAAQRGLKSQLVIPTTKGWAVKRGDSSRASAILPTKRQAISRAKKIAANQGTSYHVLD